MVKTAEDTPRARAGLLEWMDALRQETDPRHIILFMKSKYDRRGFTALTVSLVDQRRVA